MSGQNALRMRPCLSRTGFPTRPERVGKPVLLFASLAAVLVLAWATTALGDQQWYDLVRVEEDWELVVSDPDPATDAPQVTCVISPVNDIGGVHALFELNMQTVPTGYIPGGMQLQIWEGEVPLGQRTATQDAVLATPGEVITWTQSMEISDGVLSFQVTNGNSSTWGNFTGENGLRANIATSLANLGRYHSGVSVQNSGAGFADNRLQSLVIKKVRYYLACGWVYEDDQVKPIHSPD
jgi:hypothetical protein